MKLAFKQLVESIEKLYGERIKLTEKTWPLFNEKIKDAYVDSNYEKYVLKNVQL